MDRILKDRGWPRHRGSRSTCNGQQMVTQGGGQRRPEVPQQFRKQVGELRRGDHCARYNYLKQLLGKTKELT